MYSTWFIFYLVQHQVLLPEKAFRISFAIFIPDTPDSALHPETPLQEFPGLTVLYFRSYFLQNSFFFPAGTFLSPLHETASEKEPELPSSPENEFLTLLSNKNKEKTEEFLEKLFQHYNENQKTLPNQAKDLYYKLFRALDECSSSVEVNFIRLPGKSDRCIGENIFLCETSSEAG